ncbi:MAG: Uma2 family endonuclease [Cyanobacteria bacterium J06638_28]
MTQAKLRFQSFEDYLAYDDDSDALYELFNGELIAVPPESGKNVQIANRLFLAFTLSVGIDCVRGNGLELEVRGEPKNRYPDLTILQAEHIDLLAERNTIRLFMPPPMLVVEVVRPGSLQRDRDYIAKRRQYEDLGIPEYGIVDPQEQAVLVLALDHGAYDESETFVGEDGVRSRQLPTLSLKVADIFALAQPDT